MGQTLRNVDEIKFFLGFTRILPERDEMVAKGAANCDHF